MHDGTLCPYENISDPNVGRVYKINVTTWNSFLIGNAPAIDLTDLVSSGSRLFGLSYEGKLWEFNTQTASGTLPANTPGTRCR